MSFVDFTEVKARCSIEQAAELLPRDSRSAGYLLGWRSPAVSAPHKDRGSQS